MKSTKYFTKIALCAMLFAGVALGSCAESIDMGLEVEKGDISAAGRMDGLLLDKSSNNSQTVIEMNKEAFKTEVYFLLSKIPNKGVDVKVSYDADYLKRYNEVHGTNFLLYPTTSVTLDHDGKLLLAPDESSSLPIGISVDVAPGLVAGQTYLIPLRVDALTEGITISESSSRAVYLVKYTENASDTNKGEGAMKNVVYFEVNDANPLNALEFVLKDSGKLFFDVVVLFSANINYDVTRKQVVVYNNPNVQFLLDNNETFLQPLRKRGIKVLLGILGNHDISGLAQLSTIGAKQFARELKIYCDSYNLDGVSFDDEYSLTPDLTNPLFAPRNEASASRLMLETKKVMPDKMVMIYYLGKINRFMPATDGLQPGQFVDLAVADYKDVGPTKPILGMPISNCSGASVQLRLVQGDESPASAKKYREAGYGWYMYFALDPDFYTSAARPQIKILQDLCVPLHDDELLEPQYYYKKNDTTPYKR